MVGPASLRARLAAWYLLALAVPLAAFGWISYTTLSREVALRTDGDIEAALGVFVREAGAERFRGPSARDALVKTVSEIRFADLRIIVRDTAGTLVAMGEESDAGEGADGDRVVAALSRRPADTSVFVVPGPFGGNRVVSRPLSLGGEHFVVSVAYPMRDAVAALDRIRTLYVAAIPVLVILAGLGAWWLAQRGLAPVASMASRAGAISIETRHQRLDVPGDAELGRLARAFNGLLDRLDAALAQQQQFMADASHELRTPVATLKAEAEITLARERREEGEYRESVAVMRDAAARLKRIVDDLFLLARADAGHLAPRMERIDLADVARRAGRSIAQVAEAKGVRVTVDAPGPAFVHADPDLLTRVLVNLLDNAVKHAPAGTEVAARVAAAQPVQQVSVTDAGPGIPPEMAGRLFERFYRGDPSRGRTDANATDGAGLGLAIARSIAVVHGGDVALASSSPGHTEFRVTIPAA